MRVYTLEVSDFKVIHLNVVDLLDRKSITKGENMPLFEYKCDTCGEKFELIRSASETDAVKCPSCGNLAEKQLSVFAKPNSGSSVDASFNSAPRGGCGSGNCGFGGCGL
jgi:putative FmdB family regulatory protein